MLPFLKKYHAMPIASAPLGMIIKLVEPVNDGTMMKSRLIRMSGRIAIFIFLRKYLYAIAPNSAATTLENAGCSASLWRTGCSG